MQRILDTNIYVGGLLDVIHTDNKWAFVHATQTVHYKMLGWNRKNNKPDKSHPNYLYLRTNYHLSLNWVDGRPELFEWYGPSGFSYILDFIESCQDKKILVHCDSGISRSPSIVLLYLAKRLTRIPTQSFLDAKREFMYIYPAYNPGGIATYIECNWNKII